MKPFMKQSSSIEVVCCDAPIRVMSSMMSPQPSPDESMPFKSRAKEVTGPQIHLRPRVAHAALAWLRPARVHANGHVQVHDSLWVLGGTRATE